MHTENCLFRTTLNLAFFLRKCPTRSLFLSFSFLPSLSLSLSFSHVLLQVLEGEKAQDLSHRICNEIFTSSSTPSSFDYQVDTSSASSHVVVAALRARSLAPPSVEGGEEEERSIGSRSTYDIYRDPNPKEAMVSFSLSLFSFFPFPSDLSFPRFLPPSFPLSNSMPLIS